MRKAWMIGCTGIAVLAVALVVAGFASAASWKVNGALLAGSAALATTAKTVESAKVNFSTITVECTGEGQAFVAPQITHPESASASSLVFTGCKAIGGNCALVGTTINTVAVAALAQVVGSTVLAVVKPKTKTTFATVEFSGASCAFAAEVQPVTGTMLMSMPTGGTESEEQEVVVNTPSGEVKVGSSAASVKLKKKHKLASGLPWSLR